VSDLSSKPTEESTHQESGVEPIGFGAAAVTRYGDTGCMNDEGLDPAGSQPSGKPKAVSPRFVGNYHARDCLTGRKSFLAPACQQAHQRILVWLELLQRSAIDPGKESSDEPCGTAHLYDNDKGLIRNEGGRRSANVALLQHGASP
jgi:hypothetical protein